MKLCSITYIRIYTVLNDFIYINDSVERSSLLLFIHGLLWWLCISGLSHKSPPDPFEFFLTVAIVCWDPVLSLSDWQNHQKDWKQSLMLEETTQYHNPHMISRTKYVNFSTGSFVLLKLLCVVKYMYIPVVQPFQGSTKYFFFNSIVRFYLNTILFDLSLFLK